MEARFSRVIAPVMLLVVISSPLQIPVHGAGYRTANFTVAAPTTQLAKEIGDTAERFRRELAIEWLGEELPNWRRPCQIKARVAPNLGAGGATSFVFDQGEVFGWRMDIQGNRQRILDSVVPHEVTHTIFASHFRRPLPRWADEGACTTVEDVSEVSKQERMLIEFLQTNRGIRFSDMFVMTEYPRDVLPLYAQGHSLAKFLIDQRGKREFLAFLTDGMEHGNWPRAIQARYGYSDLLTLQNSWLGWVAQGRPQLQFVGDTDQNATLVAAHEGPLRGRSEPRPKSNPVVRGQDPAARPTGALVPLGVDGPIGTIAHGDTVVSQPWSGTVRPTPPVAAASEPASVYDTRASQPLRR